MSQESNSFSLEEILPLNTVRARVQVGTWQQAADAVGQLLVAAGKVESRYVEKMRQIVEEMGPYMVIAPGVALLHARPEDGVLAPCIGLITLTEPVAFGHPHNDPVDIVIALGTSSKESHLKALQQLAGRLGNAYVIDQLRSAASDQALRDALLSSN